jgi:hypothetical protein
MPARQDKSPGISNIQLLKTPALKMDADAILEEFTNNFGRLLGRRTIRARSAFVYDALAFASRVRMMERWRQNSLSLEQGDG